MRFFSTLFKAASKPRQAVEPTLSPSDAPATRQLLLVTILGAEPARIAEIVERTSAAHPGIKIVYVTDTLDFAIFRERKATFEYIPSLSEQNRHAEAMNWPRYLKRRWELIEAKWAPTQSVAYGLNFDRLLAASERAGTAGKH
nr:hypothetical protein [uncultured Shinella sp.]